MNKFSSYSHSSSITVYGYLLLHMYNAKPLNHKLHGTSPRSIHTSTYIGHNFEAVMFRTSYLLPSPLLYLTHQIPTCIEQRFIQRGGHWDFPPSHPPERVPSPQKFNVKTASIAAIGIQHNTKVQHNYSILVLKYGQIQKILVGASM